MYQYLKPSEAATHQIAEMGAGTQFKTAMEADTTCAA